MITPVTSLIRGFKCSSTGVPVTKITASASRTDDILDVAFSVPFESASRKISSAPSSRNGTFPALIDYITSVLMSISFT